MTSSLIARPASTAPRSRTLRRIAEALAVAAVLAVVGIVAREHLAPGRVPVDPALQAWDLLPESTAAWIVLDPDPGTAGWRALERAGVDPSELVEPVVDSIAPAHDLSPSLGRSVALAVAWRDGERDPQLLRVADVRHRADAERALRAAGWGPRGGNVESTPVVDGDARLWSRPTGPTRALLLTDRALLAAADRRALDHALGERADGTLARRSTTADVLHAQLQGSVASIGARAGLLRAARNALLPDDPGAREVARWLTDHPLPSSAGDGWVALRARGGALAWEGEVLYAWPEELLGESPALLDERAAPRPPADASFTLSMGDPRAHIEQLLAVVTRSGMDNAAPDVPPAAIAGSELLPAIDSLDGPTTFAAGDGWFELRARTSSPRRTAALLAQAGRDAGLTVERRASDRGVATVRVRYGDPARVASPPGARTAAPVAATDRDALLTASWSTPCGDALGLRVAWHPISRRDERLRLRANAPCPQRLTESLARLARSR